MPTMLHLAGGRMDRNTHTPCFPNLYYSTENTLLFLLSVVMILIQPYALSFKGTAWYPPVHS